MPTREEIEEIRARVNIADLIGRYVHLKPRGSRYVGVCPFHPDKSPSLTVSPEKGLYHCFGCGEGGDVFRFLMAIERIEFPEAVRRLAEEAGVSLSLSRSRSRDGDSGEGQKERLRALLERVTRFFEGKLREPLGRRALRYLTEARGFTEETVRRFRLGYAPPGDLVLQAFSRELPELQKLGLVLEGDRGRWSFFRDRVIFPLTDVQGRVVGLAGRTLKDKAEEPKYLNTRATPLFEKGQILYGLAQARSGLAQQGYALLVEGYTDAITAHQYGFTNAVASMGTAFTPQQARLLRRFVPKVLLAYDRDAAGRAATLRGMAQLLRAGLEVEVVVLPPGEDPDGLLRRGGPEALRELLQGARSFPEFYVQALLEEHDVRSLRGQEEVLSEVQAFLAHLESPVLRTRILGELSGSLDIPLEELQSALQRKRGMQGERPAAIMAPEAPKRAQVPVPGRVPARAWGVEEHLMSLLLQGVLPLERAVRELAPVDFPRFSPAMQTLFSLYREREERGESLPERLVGPEGQAFLREWLERLDPETQRALRALAVSEKRDSNEHRAVEELIGQLRLKSVERRLREIQRAIREAERTGDRAALERLQGEQQRELHERRRLLTQLGWGTFAAQGGGRDVYG